MLRAVTVIRFCRLCVDAAVFDDAVATGTRTCPERFLARAALAHTLERGSGGSSLSRR